MHLKVLQRIELDYSLLEAMDPKWLILTPDFLWLSLAFQFKFQVVSPVEAIAIGLVSLFFYIYIYILKSLLPFKFVDNISF